MKIAFVPKKFNVEQIDVIRKAIVILESYAAQGYDLSLRQLYYQFIARNWFPEDRTWRWTGSKWVRDPDGTPNAEPNYQWLGVVIGDARLAGLIDWDHIKDRGRIKQAPQHWESPLDILKAAAETYRIDKWEDQDNYVEVMVEKQALEGVLIPVCAREDVTFTANKGYSSLSYMYEAGMRWREQIKRFAKRVHVIYLGDHDPSGIDMTRDILDRGRMFADGGFRLHAPKRKGGKIKIDELDPIEDDWLQVHRVALNMSQIDVLNPPENPAKLTDSRARSYVEQFGYSSWELDAIEPRQLDQIVTDKIDSLRHHGRYSLSIDREMNGRDKLHTVVENYR